VSVRLQAAREAGLKRILPEEHRFPWQIELFLSSNDSFPLTLLAAAHNAPGQGRRLRLRDKGAVQGQTAIAEAIRDGGEILRQPVDRVLNERGGVSPQTTRKVLQAAREAGLKRILPFIAPLFNDGNTSKRQCQ
jgi:hypothetical protein